MRLELPTDENPCVVIEGDCLEVLPLLPKGCVDAVVTDPPYGIKEAAGKNKSRGKAAVARDYGNQSWDDRPADEAVALAVSLARHSIVFGGNYYTLPPSSCWLVWDKLNGSNDFADCELAWTNLRKAVRRIQHRWNGMIREGHEERFHPTQKPLNVMRWAILQLPADSGLILDPFAGSGTTGVAAILEGRKAILIEKDPAYAAIARRRIAQALGDGPGTLIGSAKAATLFDGEAT